VCGRPNWEGESLGFSGGTTKINLVLLLVVVFKSLNFGHLQPPPPNPIVLNNPLFDELTSIEEGNESLLKSKLSSFHWIVVLEEDLKSLLAWWKTHESQFLNVGFLTKQILGILRSQIKIECIFNIAIVLTIYSTTDWVLIIWMP
jgi:hypothetical protein